MKEDMEKIFGKEFRYLKRLSAGQLVSLVWFSVSLFLTALLADVSLLATLLSAVSMFLSIASLVRLPDFDDE
jgi:hypothetical protein